MANKNLGQVVFHPDLAHEEGANQSPAANNTVAGSAGKVVSLYVADARSVPEIEALGLGPHGDYYVPCPFDCEGPKETERHPADQAFLVARRRGRRGGTVYNCYVCGRAGLYGPPRRRI